MSSCVILAAGLSNRMGKKKPLLRFNNELTFLEKIVSVYKSWGVEKPVVVVNRDVLFKINQLKSQWLEDCKFVLNQHIGYGRFYSIKLGLQNIMKNLPVFIHNVDNPFVNHCVLQLLF
ncbi:MAG: nucleotidyltransferase family protein, partial [Bacteroidales bacterium]|nr:nucleotidyltransferase family protein [Bacteroidales bacterium]